MIADSASAAHRFRVAADDFERRVDLIAQDRSARVYYEILFTETPDPVAINEAINLAKRYGTRNSAQFVNGILDRLMKRTLSPEK